MSRCDAFLQKAAGCARRKASEMEVVCIIGERLYHAPGSECHRKLTQNNAVTVLTLTEAQAHEVGMEPCGYCIVGDESHRTP
jgi:hypothetical protein